MTKAKTKAVDFPVGSEVVLKSNKTNIGLVLTNTLKKGPEYLVVEWQKTNEVTTEHVSHLFEASAAKALEAEFKQLKDSVNEKINQAVALLEEAGQLASARGYDLSSRQPDSYDRMFQISGLQNTLEDITGWSSSSMDC
jgi:hypothetical protein